MQADTTVSFFGVHCLDYAGLSSFPYSVGHNSSRIDHRVQKQVIGSILLLCLCTHGSCWAGSCFVMTLRVFCAHNKQPSHMKTPRRDFAVNRGTGTVFVPDNC